MASMSTITKALSKQFGKEADNIGEDIIRKHLGAKNKSTKKTVNQIMKEVRGVSNTERRAMEASFQDAPLTRKTLNINLAENTKNYRDYDITNRELEDRIIKKDTNPKVDNIQSIIDGARKSNNDPVANINAALDIRGLDAKIDMTNPIVNNTSQTIDNPASKSKLIGKKRHTPEQVDAFENRSYSEKKELNSDAIEKVMEMAKKENGSFGAYSYQGTNTVGAKLKNGVKIPTHTSAKVLGKETDLSTHGMPISVNRNILKEVANKKESKIFNQNNLKTAVGVGVSGAIVLNMFNSGGQQSNSELYGQKQGY